MPVPNRKEQHNPKYIRTLEGELRQHKVPLRTRLQWLSRVFGGRGGLKSEDLYRISQKRKPAGPVYIYPYVKNAPPEVNRILEETYRRHREQTRPLVEAGKLDERKAKTMAAIAAWTNVRKAGYRKVHKMQPTWEKYAYGIPRPGSMSAPYTKVWKSMLKHVSENPAVFGPERARELIVKAHNASARAKFEVLKDVAEFLQKKGVDLGSLGVPSHIIQEVGKRSVSQSWKVPAALGTMGVIGAVGLGAYVGSKLLKKRENPRVLDYRRSSGNSARLKDTRNVGEFFIQPRDPERVRKMYIKIMQHLRNSGVAIPGEEQQQYADPLSIAQGLVQAGLGGTSFGGSIPSISSSSSSRIAPEGKLASLGKAVLGIGLAGALPIAGIATARFLSRLSKVHPDLPEIEIEDERPDYASLEDAVTYALSPSSPSYFRKKLYKVLTRALKYAEGFGATSIAKQLGRMEGAALAHSPASTAMKTRFIGRLGWAVSVAQPQLLKLMPKDVPESPILNYAVPRLRTLSYLSQEKRMAAANELSKRVRKAILLGTWQPPDPERGVKEPETLRDFQEIARSLKKGDVSKRVPLYGAWKIADYSQNSLGKSFWDSLEKLPQDTFDHIQIHLNGGLPSTLLTPDEYLTLHKIWHQTVESHHKKYHDMIMKLHQQGAKYGLTGPILVYGARSPELIAKRLINRAIRGVFRPPPPTPPPEMSISRRMLTRLPPPPPAKLRSLLPIAGVGAAATGLGALMGWRLGRKRDYLLRSPILVYGARSPKLIAKRLINRAVERTLKPPPLAPPAEMSISRRMPTRLPPSPAKLRSLLPIAGVGVAATGLGAFMGWRLGRRRDYSLKSPVLCYMSPEKRRAAIDTLHKRIIRSMTVGHWLPNEGVKRPETLPDYLKIVRQSRVWKKHGLPTTEEDLIRTVIPTVLQDPRHPINEHLVHNLKRLPGGMLKRVRAHVRGEGPLGRRFRRMLTGVWAQSVKDFHRESLKSSIERLHDPALRRLQKVTRTVEVPKIVKVTKPVSALPLLGLGAALAGAGGLGSYFVGRMIEKERQRRALKTMFALDTPPTKYDVSVPVILTASPAAIGLGGLLGGLYAKHRARVRLLDKMINERRPSWRQNYSFAGVGMGGFSFEDLLGDVYKIARNKALKDIGLHAGIPAGLGAGSFLTFFLAKRHALKKRLQAGKSL